MNAKQKSDAAFSKMQAALNGLSDQIAALNRTDFYPSIEGLKILSVGDLMIAETLGVSRSLLNMWRNGNRKPEPKHLVAMNILLEKSIQSLCNAVPQEKRTEHFEIKMNDAEFYRQLQSEKINKLGLNDKALAEIAFYCGQVFGDDFGASVDIKKTKKLLGI